MKRRHLWLCLGPVLFCVLDAGLTLHGQSAAYWAGGYDQAVEANPPFLWLLHLHPGAFVAGVLVWLALASLLILHLPGPLARVLTLVVLFVHTLGAASWLVPAGLPGYLAAVLLIALARLSLDATWRRAARENAGEGVRRGDDPCTLG